ncbi:MAG: hypothetical protein ACXVAY_00390 [Mucilaginibacter sp.]
MDRKIILSYSLAFLFLTLLAATGCKTKPVSTAPHFFMTLSTDSAENDHLIRILLSHKKDSVIKCADADYKAHKYYYFLSTDYKPAFDHYFRAYAKQKYHLILIKHGDVGRDGVDYYNSEMGAFLDKDKLKTTYQIMLEAKKIYNETLPDSLKF